MLIQRLIRQCEFPDPNGADADGLVAYGGDLSPQRLLAAYAQGLFPWPGHKDWPILWFSPDPRMVLLPSALHMSRRLQRTLKHQMFDVRFDTAFARVIHACATIPRPNQPGTWITPDMIEAYCRLHELGFAHSAEAWAEGQLVGGVYGVSLGAAFFGESMFTQRRDASKVAFVQLVRQLHAWDFHFVDCQVYSAHLASLGAVVWSRRQFFQALENALRLPTRRGCWSCSPTAFAS